MRDYARNAVSGTPHFETLIRVTLSGTLLKIQPYYSQPSRENGTPFSGTSPLYRLYEVPPTPREFFRFNIVRQSH